MVCGRNAGSRDARRVEAALATNPDLVRQYAAIQEEYTETIHLNESLGAPSAAAMHKLFAAIDAEPARAPQAASIGVSKRIMGFFAGLSPRTLAWSTSLGAVLLLLQAGIIGKIMMEQSGGTFETASYQQEPARKPRLRLRRRRRCNARPRRERRRARWRRPAKRCCSSASSRMPR